MLSPWRKNLRRLVLILGLLSGVVLAGELVPVTEEARAGSKSASELNALLARLRCMSPDELEQLYGQADAGGFPVGFARGRLLVLTETRMPKVKERLANFVWKGKHFEEDGRFINQWAGLRALHSHVVSGPSWFDGRPCIIMEYPEGTPLFANMRDEIREIAPGVYLGRFYERCPQPKFRGFFALVIEPEKDHKSHRR